MQKIFVLAIGGILLSGGVALATPPGPGFPFDCSDGGTSSCATDDTGCVSESRAALKCSSMIGKAFSKAQSMAAKCHMKQATMRSKGSSESGAGTSEENCETNPGKSAQGVLDATLAKLAAAGICNPAQLANASAQEGVLFGTGPTSLDAENVNVYCDASSGVLIGDDDSGWVTTDPNTLKCEITVAKALDKLVAFGAKCHDKMNAAFFKGNDFDEETCEMTDPISTKGALDKFNRVRDRLVTLGICPACLDAPALDTLAANAINKLDAENASTYPCGL
jgi:hypothetical protein